MTNKEWLDYLAHNAPDELAAWFDAEHVETKERALDGDTEPQNADSRERLEADAFAYLQTAYITYPQIIKLLDRQAEITKREWCDEQGFWNCAEDAVMLSAQVVQLIHERDELREKLGDTTEAISELMKKQPRTFDPHDVPGSLRLVGRYIDELEIRLVGKPECDICDRTTLLEEVEGLTAERDNLKANNQQLHTLAGEQAATIDELQKQVDELTDAGRKMSTELANMQDYITKVRAGRERYRSMCSEMATNIQDALSIADEGLA